MEYTRIYGSKLLAWLYIVFASTSILADTLYWTVSKQFAGYAKIFFYSALIVVLFDILKSRKIVNDKFLVLLALCGGAGVVIGIINNPIGKEYFAHFSPFILAIAAYSYGYRSELKGGNFIKEIDSYIIPAGFVLTGLVSVYFSLVNVGYIPYFGAGALFAYPVFYCLSKGLYGYVAVFYIANAFTGKRSVLLAITLVMLVFFWKKSGRKAKIGILFVLALIVQLAISSIVVRDGQVFGGVVDRYMSMFIYLSENDNVLEAIDFATSGRLYDALAVFERMGDSVVSWVFGLGFGATFTVNYSFSEDIHITHYSHVSPLSYLLVGGLVLLVVVYGKLLYEVKRAIHRCEDHLAMMVLYFFVMGFSGAIFFTDTFVWLFVGAFSARRYYNKDGRLAT